MWNINPLRAHIPFYKLADQDLLQQLQEPVQSSVTLCVTQATLLVSQYTKIVQTHNIVAFPNIVMAVNMQCDYSAMY